MENKYHFEYLSRSIVSSERLAISPYVHYGQVVTFASIVLVHK